MAKIPTTGKERRLRRHRRVRAAGGQGNASRPRLSVFRSNQHLYVQLIDDVNGKTLVGISSRNLTKAGNDKIRGTDKALSLIHI